MKDNWFWRVFAVLALLVALGYVVSRFSTAPPVRAGGGGGFIMEVVDEPWQAGLGKVYVLDTGRKCLLMYGSGRQRFELSLLASRYIEVDCQATVGKEFPGRMQGWSLREMQKHTEAKGATGRRTR